MIDSRRLMSEAVLRPEPNWMRLGVGAVLRPELSLKRRSWGEERRTP